MTIKLRVPLARLQASVSLIPPGPGALVVALLLVLTCAAAADASVCDATIPMTPVLTPAFAARWAEARQTVIRRDPWGHPDPAGKVGWLNAGMSTAKKKGTALRGLLKSDAWKAKRAPGVVFTDAAVSGATTRYWNTRNAPKWLNAVRLMAGDGLTPAQVALFTIMVTQQEPVSLGEMNAADLAGVVDAARFHLPNAVIVLTGHPTTVYLDPAYATKVPEPFIYNDSVLLRDFVATQGLDPFVFFYDGWLGQPMWACSDVEPSDGLHPITGTSPSATAPNGTGAKKLATLHMRQLQQGLSYDAATGTGLLRP